MPSTEPARLRRWQDRLKQDLGRQDLTGPPRPHGGDLPSIAWTSDGNAVVFWIEHTYNRRRRQRRLGRLTPVEFELAFTTQDAALAA